MKISIFTPAHKNTFLDELYESIKGQDFFEWVVLLNNGAEWKCNDKRVKIVRINNTGDNYVGALKKIACSYCTGDILLECDYDDLLTHDAIEEVKKAFKDEKIGFVYSNSIYSTADFKPCSTFSELYGWKYRDYNYKGNILKEHITFEPCPEAISRIWYAPNHLRAFRRDVYEKIGGYNGNMRILDDLDLMCRMYLVTEFKHIDKGFYIYRVHGNNTYIKFNKEIQVNVYRIYDQYIEAMIKRMCQLKGLRAIDLGGRFGNQKGYETVDLKDANINADLNKKWPFEDNSVGLIRAYDIFEHLKDPLHTIKECYRVLAPGGWILSSTPSTDGRGAFQDPTHVSFWNENSFLYYTNKNWAKYIDTPARFQATRLYTTQKNKDEVCWVNAHLLNLKDNYRTCGLVNI